MFTGDAPLACNRPELDHYGRTSLSPGQACMGPSFIMKGGRRRGPAGEGARAFAYRNAGQGRWRRF